MHLSIPRRVLVRAVSYTLALLLVCGGFTWRAVQETTDYRIQLETTYTRALGELSSYLTNLSDDLEKGQYVGTPAQLALVSARIWRESGSAKSALSTLPAGELRMDETYKFLSQVGDYAMMLSRKVAAGAALSEEEQQNAAALRKYAENLRKYIDRMQQRIHDGSLDITALRTAQNPHEGDLAAGTQVGGLSAGLKDIEQTMTGYPTLIYDGPFSDHLLTRKPRLTAGLPSVTPEQAQEAASHAARLTQADLVRADDENSNMPSYTFSGRDLGVAVTKSGGLVTYLINSREIGEERLRTSAVFQMAEKYLASLGVTGLRATYYETADGICTVNYAAMSGDVTLYTDLIKVGVALDDGSIVFYDARGYITNHYERTLPAPALTASEAQKSVNPSLAVESSRLALIPTAGQNEVLTYEFRAKAQDGQQLLVYVNAQTGAEEQILLLIETPQGTLTK